MLHIRYLIYTIDMPHFLQGEFPQSLLSNHYLLNIFHRDGAQLGVRYLKHLKAGSHKLGKTMNCFKKCGECNIQNTEFIQCIFMRHILFSHTTGIECLY